MAINNAAKMLMYDTGDMVQEPTQTTILFLFEIAITIQQKDKVLNAKYCSFWGLWENKPRPDCYGKHHHSL